MRALSVLLAVASAVTPVEKVVTLLSKLRTEIQEEGAKEAANYDKFACFCKDSADEKLYVINNAKADIKRLDAELDQLDTEIAALAKKTAADKKSISGLEDDSAKAVKARAKAHKAYVAEEKDMAGAISAIKRAINALNSSKEELTGAKLQLLARDASQIAELLAISKVQFKASALRSLQALLQAAPGEAHVSEYHSNDIIAMLQELKKTFIENKRTLDTEEADAKQAHNMEEQARQYQIKVLNDQVAEQQRIEAEKSETRAEKQEERDQTKTAQDQDQAFLDELTSTCEGKAGEWDKRSSTRAAELKAIAEAMELLEGQVSDNYGANKKLVGLAEHAQLKQTVVDFDEDEDAAALVEEDEDASFVQLSSPESKIQHFLEKAARKLKSKAISQLVLSAKADHFVKVRGLIKDLIARLEAQAEAEATQKQWCDEEMSKAINKRDENQATVEKLDGKIVSKQAKIDRLTGRIKELNEDIAALNKELNERQILRSEESEENAKVVADANEGLDAVTQAIDVLREFYNNAFVQVEPWRAKNADSAGNTVGDLAPETFDDGYRGKQSSSKGIIGILEVIKADFERTIKTTEQAESDAAKEFDQFKQDTEEDIQKKSDLKDQKTENRTKTANRKVELEDDREGAQALLDEAKKELTELAPACVDTGMSWEERSARREQEVNALKEALDILRSLDLGKGFMQRF